MKSFRLLTVMLTVGLATAGARMVLAEDREREVAAVGPFLAMIDSGVPQEEIAEVFLSGYRSSVQEAIDHLNSAPDRAIEALMKGFEDTPYEKEFKGAGGSAARRQLMVALRRESEMSQKVIKLALTEGTREQVRGLMVDLQQSMVASGEQNFSVDDFLHRTGMLVGYVFSAGARIAVKVPVLFTTNLLRSIARSAPEGWSAGRQDFDKVFDTTAYLNWIVRKLQEEADDEEWEKFKERWRRPGKQN